MMRLAYLIVMLVVAGSVSGSERVDYLTEVKPILAERCYSCHGVLKQKADLRLETRTLWQKGGDAGAVIVAGDPEGSLLFQRVTESEEERMPPAKDGSRLSDEEIDVLRRWIAEGAEAPDEPIPASPAQHWAFQKLVRPDLPEVTDPDWNQHPIDAFLAASRESENLLPVGLAEKRVLLRRAYLDVIGLPPSRDALRSFEADSSEDAFLEVVESLLENPAHGERWGRHWMDVWRYSDWYGLGQQLRNSQKHLWHWRDWIVESLNEDKGYDQMILEMLAADELMPNDVDALRGTGFLARNYYLFNRDTWLDETVEHTSKAFLGLTMNCAKCHDHKYDPISQEDYYSMRAFFEPYHVRLDSLPGETDLEKNGLPRAYDAHVERPTYLYVRGDAKNPDKSRVITPGLPTVLGSPSLNVQTVNLPPEAWRPALRAHVLQDELNRIDRDRKEVEGRLEVMRQRVSRLQDRGEEKLPDRKGKLFLEDEFDGPREDLWEAGPGERGYRDGKLWQRKLGPHRVSLRSIRDHPKDFEAYYSFTTLGGNMWRSVGFNFDVTGGREKQVYLSAVKGGSKLQASFKDGGGQVYPEEARQVRPVNLGQRYSVRILVREQLLNVEIDGELALAYRLPWKRETGKVELLAFDAEAEWDSIVIRELPSDVDLVPAGTTGDGLTLEQAKDQVALLVRELDLATSRRNSLEAAHAADRALAHEDDDSNERAEQAFQAASHLELAEAQLALLKARRKVDASPNDQKAEGMLKAARERVEKAEEPKNVAGKIYFQPRASLKALEGPDEKEASRRKPYPRTSSGRRSALARWIASSDNPLTARVMVNQVWMRHMGQPLVESVTDFGLRSSKPLQSALLDWLAVEFVESGWSFKHLHRLILTSRTYRLSSASGEEHERNRIVDPDNRYYWRRPSLRMEAELVRDSLLSIAGVLNETRGGASLTAQSGEGKYRRSLYFVHSRDGRHKFLDMFDGADILRCYRRSDSVVPQQALALANSRLALSMSRTLAKKLSADLGEVDDVAYVDAAYETVLGVLPTAIERLACIEMLNQTRALLKGNGGSDIDQRSRANLVHALVNHNDFVTIR